MWPSGGGRLPAIPRCLGAVATISAYQCPYTGPGQPCARTVSDRCSRGRERGRLSATVRWLEASHAAVGTKYSMRHGSNAGHSSGVAGVDARRATPPDPRLARWGLAACRHLDPSHPALVTREDPGVEPCPT